MTQWFFEHLGPDVPLHFTAFHPDWKLLDVPPTPRAALARARRLAMNNGLRYVYTGNVRDVEGATTFCRGCGLPLVVRDGYDITSWSLSAAGRCTSCGTVLAGVFEPEPGSWGNRRLPIRMRDEAGLA